jgi:predicted nucleic acid-binding protein
MAILIDTSLWIAMYRDRSGKLRQRVKSDTGNIEPVFTGVIATEILQGCMNEDEWHLVSDYLADQRFIEMKHQTWINAARIYFDLRREGVTIRGTIDCCIAQLAIEHDFQLLHCDRDFDKIADIRPLKHLRVDISEY